MAIEIKLFNKYIEGLDKNRVREPRNGYSKFYLGQKIGRKRRNPGYDKN
jgi:hypothetical protein